MARNRPDEKLVYLALYDIFAGANMQLCGSDRGLQQNTLVSTVKFKK
jgi:hypothetical protein